MYDRVDFNYYPPIVKNFLLLNDDLPSEAFCSVQNTRF